MTRLRAVAVLALSLLFGFAPAALAQTVQQGGVSVTVTPANPGPNQSVTITLDSFSVNLQAAAIVWTVDGTVALRGVGQDALKLTTKKLGQPTSVSVTVTAQGADPVVKSIVIVPATVDLLWQATDSTVPPFYRGKAMPLSESKVTFTAVVNSAGASGTIIPPASLIYNWQQDNDADQAHSGYGKNSFNVSMDYLNPLKQVSVGISTTAGADIAQADTTLSASNPKLLWYASSPLYGPSFDHAISGGYSVDTSDVSLLVEPYFFSPGNPTASMLTYNWQLNGAPLTTPSVPNTVFLHRDAKATGSAGLDVSVEAAGKLFQALSSHLDLILK